MAGRMVLIKSSLDSIPTYWFRLHWISKSILRKMDVIRKKFFLGELANGEEYVRKLHTVSWNLIFSSKEKGGLNLSKIESRILVLLSKWWWKFNAEKTRIGYNSFWKYGHNFIYNAEESPKNMSLMFKEILNCRNEYALSCSISNRMFKWSVGDGTKVKFWKDYWCGNDELRISFHRLYSLALDKDISVA